MSNCLNPTEVFHIHTYRCHHAGTEKEEEYIQNAIWLGAKSIAFSDHAPFPGDPFRFRMRISELSDYETTLWDLKRKYEGKIDVRIGLEIEYLPGYKTYYEELLADPKMEFLLLGQHFAELAPGKYSFVRKDRHGLADTLMAAEVEAVKTGYFSYVAHPDRAYRYLQDGEVPDTELAKALIQEAGKREIPLEKNMSSIERDEFFPGLFWKYAKDDFLIGMDAHSVAELRRRYCFAAFLEERKKERENVR